jgi:hypothetical protein
VADSTTFDDLSPTPLQRRLVELTEALGDARGLNQREREVYASVGARLFARAFASELVLAEAEMILAGVA